MGFKSGDDCKKCRRSQEKLFLKGERCHTAKCEIEKRNFPPGIRSIKQSKLSEFGRRLREKQKLRWFYGVTESQISTYFKKAANQKGITGNNLLSMFERRLDNVAFRTNLARSRKEARQLVKHAHFLVNGKKADIPSIILTPGDVISVAGKSQKQFEDGFTRLDSKGCPEWLHYDAKEKTVKVQQLPERHQIDVPVEEHLIVEYYSR